MKPPVEAAVLADIARLIDTPALASVKRLSKALADSVLEGLPDPSVVDPESLLRRCATVVLLSEQEGHDKVKPLIASNERLIAALERRVAALEDGFESLSGEREILREVAIEQEALIVAQARLLDRVVDGVGLRELRLPH